MGESPSSLLVGIEEKMTHLGAKKWSRMNECTRKPGGEEREASCVIIPSCAGVAVEEELAPLLLCWLLGGDARKMKEGVF